MEKLGSELQVGDMIGIPWGSTRDAIAGFYASTEKNPSVRVAKMELYPAGLVIHQDMPYEVFG